MNFVRPICGTAALCALVAAAFFFSGLPARGFDLQGSPVTIHRPGTDITDVYFFPSPTNPNNVVAVMDVDPSIPAGAGLTTFFDQGVLYTMKFDTRYSAEAVNARPVENVVIQFAVGAPTGPVGNQTQQINVYGPNSPAVVGAQTRLIGGAVASGVGFVNRPFSISSGQIQVFAGARRDPQFFDKTQFFNIFPASTQASGGTSCLSSSCPNGFGPGTDYFADSNVLSFVVELPKTLLTGFTGATGTVVAFWATTSTSTGT
jgi:hypothetical protein